MIARFSPKPCRPGAHIAFRSSVPGGLILLLLILGLSLPGCAQPEQPKHSGESPATVSRLYTVADVATNEQVPLPSWVDGPEQEGYQFALAHPELLEYIPCYCGCGMTSKHKSNLDCYVRGLDENGAVVFDNHAVSCGVCLDITLDVKRLNGEGKLLKDIRTFIDGKYSKIGPGTDTPLPPD